MNGNTEPVLQPYGGKWQLAWHARHTKYSATSRTSSHNRSSLNPLTPRSAHARTWQLIAHGSPGVLSLRGSARGKAEGRGCEGGGCVEAARAEAARVEADAARPKAEAIAAMSMERELTAPLTAAVTRARCLRNDAASHQIRKGPIDSSKLELRTKPLRAEEASGDDGMDHKTMRGVPLSHLFVRDADHELIVIR